MAITWTDRLHKTYDNDFEQFEAYDSIYALAVRLGFPSAEAAWEANPVIGGSTDPRDFQVIHA